MSGRGSAVGRTEERNVQSQRTSKLAEICRREGLSPNLVYLWRKALMKSADSIFARKTKDGGPVPKIERMEAENTRMKNVIAENLELRKTRSD
ncbi:MAG: transposase [Planctomycetes bacterium]|nr:transposase [Planctomycetota bacterium]